MKTDRVQTSWGTSWLLLGLLTCAGTAAATRRDDLLLLILAFYLVSILLVGVVCKDVPKAIGQLGLGFLGLVGSTVALIATSFEPMAAVPIWFGVVAGTANLFMEGRLSILALLGQLVPVVLLAGANMYRHELGAQQALVSVLLGSTACFAGNFLSRLWAARVSSQAPTQARGDW